MIIIKKLKNEGKYIIKQKNTLNWIKKKKDYTETKVQNSKIQHNGLNEIMLKGYRVQW